MERRLSKQELLRKVREYARQIRQGERARIQRDNLFEKARTREDITLDELARAAGVTPNGVKFARASRRRKARLSA